MNDNQNLVNQTENTEPQIDRNIIDNTSSFDFTNSNTQLNTNSVENTSQITNNDLVDTTSSLFNNNNINSNITIEPVSSPPNIRYNAVTGEELNVDEIINGHDGKLKTVEVEYKPASTFSTILLVLFFIMMLVFIIYLPDIVVLVDNYNKKRNGTDDGEKVEILTGKLVCTLDTSTVNLDRTIERVFQYTDNKLTGAKFSTTVRGDATLDEEALVQLANQCEQIKENVIGLDGISVDCEYQPGKLIEKEIFDYTSYDSLKVGNAYLEAGGSLLEFANGEEIDKVMVRMRQSGFTCEKEK